MTTIIGLQHDWGTEIFADGQTTAGDNRPYRGESRKVVQRGEYLIGAAGPGAVCDAVTLGWLPPPFKGRNPLREMVSEVIPHLRSYLSDELGYVMEEGDDDKSKAEFLIAVHGVLYYVAVDGTVLTHQDGLMGIGSGSAYAIGALYAGANIHLAMTIAEMNDVYTGPTYHIQEQVKPGKEKPSAGEPSPDSSPLPDTDSE